MKKNILIIIVATLCLGFGEKGVIDMDIRQAYISDVSILAIEEMKNSGIPASIKIAQSIVETSWGKSDLALRANNYFGIKCKSWWTGDTYYKVDDDRDADGELMLSCFRAYSSMEESFLDHSEFLQVSPFYKSLFQLKPFDYKGWAMGLKECGYATDKSYPTKLINLIETYKLYEYDKIALSIE